MLIICVTSYCHKLYDDDDDDDTIVVVLFVRILLVFLCLRIDQLLLVISSAYVIDTFSYILFFSFNCYHIHGEYRLSKPGNVIIGRKRSAFS